MKKFVRNLNGLRKEEKRIGHLRLSSGKGACVMREAHCSSNMLTLMLLFVRFCFPLLVSSSLLCICILVYNSVGSFFSEHSFLLNDCFLHLCFVLFYFIYFYKRQAVLGFSREIELELYTYVYIHTYVDKEISIHPLSTYLSMNLLIFIRRNWFMCYEG